MCWIENLKQSYDNKIRLNKLTFVRGEVVKVDHCKACGFYLAFTIPRNKFQNEAHPAEPVKSSKSCLSFVLLRFI